MFTGKAYELCRHGLQAAVEVYRMSGLERFIIWQRIIQQLHIVDVLVSTSIVQVLQCDSLRPARQQSSQMQRGLLVKCAHPSSVPHARRTLHAKSHM